jgi:hypothetical protein
MLRYSFVLLACLCVAGPAWADSWADSLFEEVSNDFGAVPRGPAVVHPFKVTNNTGKTVHISGVRVSCGCTTAWALKDELAPGESTSIQESMDTRRFQGIKNVNVFVSFDRPEFAEVRLWVQANGRDDIAVNPDDLAFGKVKRGNTPSLSVTVTFYGNSQLKATEVKKDSNYVQIALKEVKREGSEVAYQLTATMRGDTPVGKWYSDLWLKTDQPSIAKVRVPLTVEIEASLSLSSSSVNMGQVKPGAEVERKIIVRGVKPFKIAKIQGTDEHLSVRESSAESKTVHILTVKFKADKPGDMSRKLKVITDLKDEGEVEFEAKAQVES